MHDDTAFASEKQPAPEMQPETKDSLPFKLSCHPGRSIRNNKLFAPELLIWPCPVCGCDILYGCLSRGAFWIRTIEPTCWWIRIGIDLDYFLWLTGACRVHDCCERVIQ